MTDIKKGAEASQAVNNFAEKGDVEAFACGAAKVLTEKAKSGLSAVKDNATFLQFATGVALGLGQTPEAFATGTVLIVDAVNSYLKEKPTLLKRLIEPKQTVKDINNVIKNTIAKGR
ncbi:MAG: hypothetical protein KAJ75_08225 [Alphaproteobacteria bacterium]|nr:hypothetical protein [Alphaproteobacteria bacterium]